MKWALLAAITTLGFAGTAKAQVRVHVNIGWAAPPPVYEVSPGVQVVEGYDQEVFLSNGYYWVERGGRWYWTTDYRGHWVPAPYARVPVFIRDHRRGYYVRWHHRGWRQHRRDMRGERRDDRALRHERREERRDVHQQEPVRDHHHRR